MLPEKLSIISQAIEEFNNLHKDLNFEITPNLYCLFPEKENEIEFNSKWPEGYPNADKQGVYIMFDDKLNLLYIGKASANSTLGKRLGHWFKYGEGNKCHLNYDTWQPKPRFLVTIAAQKNKRYEVPALEEFLISKLHPSANFIGTAS